MGDLEVVNHKACYSATTGLLPAAAAVVHGAMAYPTRAPQSHIWEAGELRRYDRYELVKSGLPAQQKEV